MDHEIRDGMGYGIWIQIRIRISSQRAYVVYGVEMCGIHNVSGFVCRVK